MKEQEPYSRDWLLEKGQIVEKPFISNVPFVGPLIVWLRTQWLNVAARWYVRLMTEQQNEFNRVLVNRIYDSETYVFDLATEQDRELMHLRRDVAALRQQLRKLNQDIQMLNEQLVRNAAGQDSAGDDGA